MDFDDQFGTDLIPYVMPTNEVGGTSATLPGKMKRTYGEEVLAAFYDYSTRHTSPVGPGTSSLSVTLHLRGVFKAPCLAKRGSRTIKLAAREQRLSLFCKFPVCSLHLVKERSR